MQNNIQAIILAAGFSSRMTGFKPCLPLGEVSVIERQIALFKAAGVNKPLVVCGHDAHVLAPVAERAGGLPVLNPDYATGMFSSVRAGVAALDKVAKGFFMLPVDVMLVRQATLPRLLAAHHESPGAVVHPVFAGKRGHPPLIPADLAGGILAWSGRGGLAGFLAGCEDRALEVPVADEHMLFDVDTDEDYRAALDRLVFFHLPSRAECTALLDITPNVNGMGRRHSLAVADAARQLAQALNARRPKHRQLDMRLVEAAALLHDIAKGGPDHEREGGRMLEALGYARVASVVAAHRDIDLPESAPLTEREIVFLADKLIRGDRLVRVWDRYQAKIDQYASDSEAVAAISGRRERALRIVARVEVELGASLDITIKQPEIET